MKLSALSGLVLALNGLWDKFSKEEQDLLSQDSSTWAKELQEKADSLVNDLEDEKNKRRYDF